MKENLRELVARWRQGA